jgi:hypothetical protein
MTTLAGEKAGVGEGASAAATVGASAVGASDISSTIKLKHTTSHAVCTFFSPALRMTHFLP